MTKLVKRPDIVKVFADKAMHADYLPVRFATNRLANGKLNEIANDNFEYGLESLEGDIQPRDLQSVLYYLSSNLTYLFQRGVSEFSPYEDYPANALVQHDGAFWLSKGEVKASLHHMVQDPCNPCKPPLCETPVYPSKETGWCKIISSCEYDNKIKELETKDKALETAIGNLKGVEEFKIITNPNTGTKELKVALSDGSEIFIPMADFGHIKVVEGTGEISISNADGSKIVLKKPVYEKELDQNKGFFHNKQSGLWEVDLSDLLQEHSSLEVDRNGKIKVKVDDKTIDRDKDGNIQIDPEWIEKNIDPLKKYQNALNDKAAENLKNALKDYAAKQQALQDTINALNRANETGKYLPIKEAEDNLNKIKADIEASKTNITDLYNKLKNLGLSPEEFDKLLQDLINGSKGNGKSIARIEQLPNGQIILHYTDGTKELVIINRVNTDKSLQGDGKVEPLGIRISKRADNGLIVLDDGLYLGVSSRYPNLYVDAVNGEDDNIGNRKFPLRTIKEALLRNTNGQGMNVNIWLHEGQDHEISHATAGSRIHVLNSTVNFETYGDQYDAMWDRPEIVDNYQRNKYLNHEQRINPRIVFKGITSSWLYPRSNAVSQDLKTKINDLPWLTFRSSSVTFYGITFVIDLNTIRPEVVGLGVENHVNKDGNLKLFNYNCMIYNYDSNIQCVHTSYQSRGEIQVTGTPDQVRRWNDLEATKPTKFGVIKKLNGERIASMGIFSTMVDATMSYNFREIANIPRYKPKYFIFGDHGWGTEVTASKTFALRYAASSLIKDGVHNGDTTKSNTTLDDVLSYIHTSNWYLDIAGETVIAPKTDVLYNQVRTAYNKQSY